MPNAFSPNHDNLNETIKPIIECNPLPIDYEFSIYNRLGQKVFSTTVLDESWDGTFKNKEQEVGTYDYIFSYRVNQLSEKLKQKGDITLIR
jgi:gliding motility-associated-like protein